MNDEKQRHISKCSKNPYIHLVRENMNYRLYIVSHMCQNTGDWFIRIATLVSVGRLAKGSSTALSVLIICKTAPEVLLTPVGGVIADRFDRKKMMIRLDFIAGISVLSYIVAVRSGKVGLLYLATVIRSIIQAIYDPITKSMYPMFVKDPEDLKRAAALNGMIWSGMLVVGGVISGYMSALIGVEACYVLDSVTYFISAHILSKIHGNFYATNPVHLEKEKKNSEQTSLSGQFTISVVNPIKTFVRMTKEVLHFLFICEFGALIFLKASGTMIWGAADVLNVSFTHVDGDEAESARRIGTIYSCIGLGCIISPVIANSTFLDGNEPHTLQLACIGAMLFMSLGWFGISYASSFGAICAFTSVRTFGSALIWVNSTLLMQTLTCNEMLGRVLGLEYSIARGTEALIAFIAGRLEDEGVEKWKIASSSGWIGVTLLSLWSIFHLSGRGAANRNIKPIQKKEDTLPLI